MKANSLTLLVVLSSLVTAHGDHSEEKSTDLKLKVPEGLTWEKWHMKQEHGLDDYDAESFFQLHDTKSKGYLDDFDILNTYGLSREEVVGNGDGLGDHDDSEVIDLKTKQEIVSKILKLFDLDGDNKISKEEYLKYASTQGEFPDMNVGVGHHGDFEHEYEVHHWNKYHKDNDPNIKIIHKEDIEHELLHHEHEIEHEINEQGQNIKTATDEELELRIIAQNIPDKYKA